MDKQEGRFTYFPYSKRYELENLAIKHRLKHARILAGQAIDKELHGDRLLDVCAYINIFRIETI